MILQTVKLVCFSPTGTTRAVVQKIADGVGYSQCQLIDITRPSARQEPLRVSDDELLVIGVPVYMGRVPAVLIEWLNALQASNTPTVCVVVYGNRVFEDALLELKDIMVNRGCVPIACAAYIGEHSFSSSETPVAHGRPDAEDLNHAEVFGQRIREKLQSMPSSTQNQNVSVPGVLPYRGSSALWSVDFISVSEKCAQCGVCAETCPMGAIDLNDSAVIDKEKCITCCACIKICPQEARSMKPGPVKDAAKRLNEFFKDPKKPECFM
ncbi:MAG: EFR1 family ferrodoxin [Pseudodesulfovibrio sp.]|uniref:Putative ferredoxin n=1 Tax=Pseudodesulfovibrio aespoeensis (strain ATCC 700646 / DSM 10631 / Aspo-2) TaxID=643562 RepID=E6VTI7_PSEA9|nr:MULTISPECIES: EFR1 family ferrodoxin [Pseudodesulfovibrio]MBU4244787.1 EFR1 family ferrodoxin [Pseudomonadota bacterium]ADU62164.1 putative ferredoxin [Pseudodesulfovibrio aespoeensis Aspo-2]MBU4380517.1 EFR1 family ferrodoxin [Pseudomonadota bacterium]MBU4476147.1 EFR1 family ferrodoxin [Pseudomonadota bacterium]MBU4515369.1 EFR1 family ferrodoxin [Pseudomonadota bacterium]